MKVQNYLLYLFFIYVGMMFLSKNISAQNLPALYKVYGIVADSATKKPVNFSTLNLKNDENISIKTALTKSDGSFNIEFPFQKKFILVLMVAGYQTKTITIAIKDSLKRSITLDTVFIAPKINRLKEVVISADRPIIKQQADRVIYDLQADPESKGSNVLIMMRKVPFISIDAQNNILLKGNSGFKVFINGKPSGITDDNLKTILQSMPASTIQSIEVITNPPAKYDAEGLAGIINIITNKKVDFGYRGSINLNESFPVGGPGIGASFSGKQGRFGVTAYGGLSSYNSLETQFQNNRTTFGADATNLAQNGSIKSNNRNSYFGTEISYEVNPLNLITGQFSINESHSNGQNNQTSTLKNSTLLQRYNLDNTNYGSGNGTDASINYQLGFKADKNRLLTFSYRYFTYGNEQNTNLNITNSLVYLPDYQQDNHTKTSEQTFQIDYVHPFKKLIVEAGVKGILRRNTSDYQYLLYNPSNNHYEQNPANTDYFNYHQNVFSAYNSYRYNLKTWNFVAGVRAEQTIINADFLATSSTVHQNIFNIIPSVSINKEFVDKSSISFGFNQRIKRPNIRRLNPFVDRSNPDFISSGNPNLRPVLNNNLQLSYSKSKKLSVTVALGYSFIRNIDLRTSVYDTTQNLTRTTYQNTGKADYFGLDFNLSYLITNKWNIGVNGNVAYFMISGLVDGALIKNNLITHNISASSSYKFDKGWRLNVGLTTVSRNLTDLQETSNGLLRSLFGVNKELIKNKLSFATTISNPFNKYRNNIIETKGFEFIQSGISRDYFRSFSLSLNYNFGKLKQDIKKNKRGINNDDGSR